MTEALIGGIVSGNDEASEPVRLEKGKKYHSKVQDEWEETAEGDVTPEKAIKKPSGRSGRIDIHVDAGDGLVAVVELKASDWDRMSAKAVRRNVRRHVRQIWQYIESQLAEEKDVSPGIVFPQRPKSDARRQLIEELFWEEGIPVVWEDESVEERARRIE